MTLQRYLVFGLLTLVLSLSGIGMAQVRGASAATGQVVLCVGAGTEIIYVDETGTPTQAPHFCPDCVVLEQALPELLITGLVAGIGEAETECAIPHLPAGLIPVDETARGPPRLV